MTTGTATRRRKLFAGLIAAAVPGRRLRGCWPGRRQPGGNDPCAASEVARTVGSVSKSMGDYLDAHPETNQMMTTMLQQQAGPQSMTTLKSYFEANPKVAADLQTITQPLTGLSTQCKLPISLPQAMGLIQQAQGGGLPVGATARAPAQPAATQPAPPAGRTDPLAGSSRGGNTVGSSAALRRCPARVAVRDPAGRSRSGRRMGRFGAAREAADR